MSKNSSVSNYDNSLYISGHKIFGVNSVNFGYSLPVDHVSVIGYSKFKTFTSSAPQSSLSVQKYLSPADFFLNFTGLNPLVGGVDYKGKKFGFNSAYLTSYSVAASVGNFPNLNASFSIFGDVGNEFGGDGASETGALKVVRPGDIKIECDGSGTNRIESFTYSLECKREAYYHPTGSGAMEVVTVKPFKVNADFTIGVDDYEAKRAFDYLSNSNSRKITIEIGSLATFTMNSMELISETLNTSSTDDLVITLTYQGFI